jgi:ribosomal protein S1
MKLGDIVVGKVVGQVLGGARVDIDGCSAFLPADLTPIELSRLIGGRHHFKVIRIPDQGPVVVSHFRGPVSPVSEYPREPIKTYATGQECIGIVRNVAPFGAFIDMGMMDGLLLFEGTLFSSADFCLDQVLIVKIKRIDTVAEKIFLSLVSHKASNANPSVE